MSKAKDIHAYYCFDALTKYLASNEKSSYKDEDIENSTEELVATALQDMFEDEEYPLFVTWTTDQKYEGELRGCIGSFSPLSLHSGLKEYALISALRDTRFSPIKKTELVHLSCSVSLLVDFEKADNCFDWEVGKHGIRINFKDQNGNNCSSTYLPEVAEEQGWSKEETLESLMRKGGYRGNITDEDMKKVDLTRYQSHKVKVSYIQYLDFIKG